MTNLIDYWQVIDTGNKGVFVLLKPGKVYVDANDDPWVLVRLAHEQHEARTIFMSQGGRCRQVGISYDPEEVNRG